MEDKNNNVQMQGMVEQ